MKLTKKKSMTLIYVGIFLFFIGVCALAAVITIVFNAVAAGILLTVLSAGIFGGWATALYITGKDY